MEGIVIGAGNRRCGGVRELRSRHYRNLFRICAVAPAPVPGAAAAEFTIPKSIAVDFGPSDSRCTSPEQKKIRRSGRIFFCGGGAGNRTRVLR